MAKLSILSRHWFCLSLSVVVFLLSFQIFLAVSLKPFAFIMLKFKIFTFNISQTFKKAYLPSYPPDHPTPHSSICSFAHKHQAPLCPRQQVECKILSKAHSWDFHEWCCPSQAWSVIMIIKVFRMDVRIWLWLNSFAFPVNGKPLLSPYSACFFSMFSVCAHAELAWVPPTRGSCYYYGRQHIPSWSSPHCRVPWPGISVDLTGGKA